MTFELIDGEMRDEPQGDYIIRACRHGDNVTIYNLFPGSAYVYEHPEITYKKYLQAMNKYGSMRRAKI